MSIQFWSTVLCVNKMRTAAAVRTQKLERVCCKKQKKKFVTSYWFVEQGTSEDSKWYKIDPEWSGESFGLIYNQFGIIQVLQSSPIPQTSTKLVRNFLLLFLTANRLQQIALQSGYILGLVHTNIFLLRLQHNPLHLNA